MLFIIGRRESGKKGIDEVTGNRARHAGLLAINVLVARSVQWSIHFWERGTSPLTSVSFDSSFRRRLVRFVIFARGPARLLRAICPRARRAAEREQWAEHHHTVSPVFITSITNL